MSKVTKPIVFVDFDETITVKDTIALLGQVGVEAHGSRIPWSYFYQAYMDDYQREKQHQQQFEDQQSLSMPVLQKKVASLDKFRYVEKASLDRVSESGVLAGLTRQELQKAGMNKIQLRAFARSTLLEQVTPDRLYIVSLNWSKDWLHGGLFYGRDGNDGGSIYKDYELNEDHFICNDLTFDSTQKSTGIIEPTILNTSDKSQHVQSIIKRHHPGSKSIYIGDSVGDLLPLIQCDVGIIIGRNEALLDTLQQVNITVKEGIHLTTEKVIYRVDNWQTIAESGILA